MLSSLARLSRRVALYAYIAVLLNLVYLAVKIMPLRYYIKYLSKSSLGASKLTKKKQSSYALLIGRSIAKLSRYILFYNHNSCLIQAITAKILLRHFKIANSMVIGVKIDTDVDAKFLAHAWILVGERIIVGASGAGSYQHLKVFVDHE